MKRLRDCRHLRPCIQKTRTWLSFYVHFSSTLSPFGRLANGPLLREPSKLPLFPVDPLRLVLHIVALVRLATGANSSLKTLRPLSSAGDPTGSVVPSAVYVFNLLKMDLDHSRKQMRYVHLRHSGNNILA